VPKAVGQPPIDNKGRSVIEEEEEPEPEADWLMAGALKEKQLVRHVYAALQVRTA